MDWTRRRKTVRRARALRHEATDVEKRLWRALRSRQFENVKFRRQRPIGPYIVDFCALEQSLVVELDGGQHVEDGPARTRYLEANGFRVLRLWNSDVIENLDGVLKEISNALLRS